ncbi:transposase domain-containing protein [Streptomyces sp. NPDC051133]|uniref:transposase domain-containing protein n=1 Tax=Streptomyces sp. NPDC051133 TaxID=3155521 RepID=UPI00342D5326
MHPWVGLSDQVRLGVVTRWVTPELVDEVLDRCKVRDKRPGALPAGFMVCYTLALALFQQDSYDDVAKQLVGNIPELNASVPNKSSFTRARTRLGPLVLEVLFHELARPLGLAGPEGSFYRGGCGWPQWTGSSWTRRTRRPTGPRSAVRPRTACPRGSRR